MRIGSKVTTAWLALLLFALPRIATPDDRAYLSDVKPVLKSRCYACHGALKQESNLRLDTVAAMLRGGDGGPVLTAGDPDDSELIARITADDETYRMPPEGSPLNAGEIESITEWIQSGAAPPASEEPEADPRQHWSFVPPGQSRIDTEFEPTAWSLNPIDAILASEHRSRGLTPVPPATRSLLLRRVYLDLIGLPPTRNELHEFLSDERPDAWNRIVERLLASPAYGERWGRHWMDVWRYTDWYGLGEQVRNSQKHIWHWRDWIIESLNSDKGYDQMLREMLAADEIAPTDANTLRATGFLARNYYLFNRTTWLDGTIEHTSKAFLGLTMNCSKCHDHKYDPITQRDYYAFRAFFEPHQIRHDTLPGGIDLAADALPRAFDAHPEAPTYIHVRGNDKEPDTSEVIEPAVPAVLDFTPLQLEQVDLPEEAHFPLARPFVLHDHLQAAESEISAARSALASAQRALREAKSGGDASRPIEELKKDAEMARLRLAAAEKRPLAIETAYAADLAKHRHLDQAKLQPAIAAAAVAAAEHRVARLEFDILRQQNARFEGEEAVAKASEDLQKMQGELKQAREALESPGDAYDSFAVSLKSPEGPDETAESQRRAYPHISTGRRAALAEWITHPNHPLTARVAVNQIWMRHFGRPLVEPVNDLGRRTQPPALQKLLDWLAVEFMQNGWSMKHMHRLIVTSQAYRLSGDVDSTDQTTREGDPNNQFLWHREATRMQSQVVRDSLLHLAGLLDRRLGGPTIDPNTKTELRRSLYFTHSRDDRNRFVAMFDDADILRCYRRSESIIPQQALALVNGATSQYAAQVIAANLRAAMPSSSAQAQDAVDDYVSAAFETVLARQPNQQELNACRDAYESVMSTPGKPSEREARAQTVIVWSLINHNDFISIR